jgi:TusA-related sulfurtransferase
MTAQVQEQLGQQAAMPDMEDVKFMKALQKIDSGDVLSLVFDNPSSGESIMAMCEAEGNDLFDRQDGGGSFTWKIRKA